MLLAIAPICAPAALLVGQFHAIASADMRDVIEGAVMGLGVGLSLTVLIKHRIKRC